MVPTTYSMAYGAAMVVTPTAVPLFPNSKDGEKYSVVSIPDGREASLDISDATSGYIAFLKLSNTTGPCCVFCGWWLLSDPGSVRFTCMFR